LSWKIDINLANNTPRNPGSKIQIVAKRKVKNQKNQKKKKKKQQQQTKPRPKQKPILKPWDRGRKISGPKLIITYQYLPNNDLFL
jgi:hypothetical protein